ncbi:hypothetical protein LTR20_008572 [Exophiala xenobiotica]|nr:hypothetical protein LTR79_003030 [Exophiala xenobiotica]KAK5457826.1 hypothetical protein LTR20_008572 [Exophiala xenobiotica]KAK5490797.1 hypothetical protein LTR26_003557 [Exophiala xenobiotica]KAK5510043.1 hypothetical protein LTR07_010227 [Exophiala xenobiotica]
MSQQSKHTHRFLKYFHLQNLDHQNRSGIPVEQTLPTPHTEEMAQQYLKGKIAIVTGAGKPNGIGAASAIALAEQGADVAIHYNSSAGPAEEVVAKLKGLGVRAVAIKADAGAADFGKVLVDGTLKAFGTQSIDIIVNNAGTAVVNPEGIASVGVEDWDTVFHVNVRGPFMLIQAALPYMKAGGRIINVSSVIARLGSFMLPVYGASKGALTAMTIAMSEELGPKGITINTVAPGPMGTDLSMEGTPIGARLRNNQHIKREGTAKEVADTVLFMASPSASYITGQLIGVDGGISFP